MLVHGEPAAGGIAGKDDGFALVVRHRLAAHRKLGLDGMGENGDVPGELNPAVARAAGKYTKPVPFLPERPFRLIGRAVVEAVVEIVEEEARLGREGREIGVPVVP